MSWLPNGWEGAMLQTGYHPQHYLYLRGTGRKVPCATTEFWVGTLLSSTSSMPLGNTVESLVCNSRIMGEDFSVIYASKELNGKFH